MTDGQVVPGFPPRPLNQNLGSEVMQSDSYAGESLRTTVHRALHKHLQMCRCFNACVWQNRCQVLSRHRWSSLGLTITLARRRIPGYFGVLVDTVIK